MSLEKIKVDMLRALGTFPRRWFRYGFICSMFGAVQFLMQCSCFKNIPLINVLLFCFHIFLIVIAITLFRKNKPIKNLQ